MDNPVKENLKILMQADGKISEGELSRRTGIPQTTIHRILSGQIKESKPSTLKPIATYFKLSLAQLQGEEPMPCKDISNMKPLGVPPTRLVPLIPWDLANDWKEFYKISKSHMDLWLNNDSVFSNLSEKFKTNQLSDYYKTNVISDQLIFKQYSKHIETWASINRSVNHSHWLATNKIVSPSAFGLRIQGNSMTSTHGPSFEDGCEIVVDPEREPKHRDFVVAKQPDNPNAILRQLSIEAGSFDLLPLNPRYSVTHINSMNDICGVVCQLLASF